MENTGKNGNASDIDALLNRDLPRIGMFLEPTPPTFEEMVQTRNKMLTEAVGEELVPRYVARCYYGCSPEFSNLPGGFIIPRFYSELTVGQGTSEIFVSCPIDAPRETVAAVLRHLLRCVEADEPPTLEDAHNAR